MSAAIVLMSWPEECGKTPEQAPGVSSPAHSTPGIILSDFQTPESTRVSGSGAAAGTFHLERAEVHLGLFARLRLEPHIDPPFLLGLDLLHLALEDLTAAGKSHAEEPVADPGRPAAGIALKPIEAVVVIWTQRVF